LTLDLDLTRDALASSTLSHGLQVMGDRWSVALILHAFLGVKRFGDWQARLGIPRHTLTGRLKDLVGLGLMELRPYQHKPLRQAYHLTDKGLALYPQVLMMWAWERRWGSRELALPQILMHRLCGHAFVPELHCAACSGKAGIADLHLSLTVNQALLEQAPARRRGARLTAQASAEMGLGLRVDRWALLIVSSVMLGCHHFDQLSHVLRIGSSVLARRLADMVASGLLRCQPDLADARRMVYRLTPASRDLFGYIICFASWASSTHLQQPSSIRPTHRACGHAFVPRVACSHCQATLAPHAVSFATPGAPPPGP
jgi:DNA-binding HxlR family transcriptional regulator